MKIFLSYAEEDRDIAEVIVSRLENDGHEIFDWRDPRRRGRRILSQIERNIRDAGAFIVILSVDFLHSDWCSQELGMAVTRESGMRADDPNAAFIHVVDIAHTPPEQAGVLGNYDWVDLTVAQQRDNRLLELAGRFGPNSLVSSAEGAPEPAAVPPGEEPSFRNREEEVQKVINGLTNTAGPHFWLVVAPPQLGKTWFLKRISEDDALSAGPASWVVRLVDLHMQPAEVHSDAAALLGAMFERARRSASGQQTLRIAQEIARSGRPHLCLLDNAELLSGDTAKELRESLNQIRRYVHGTGKKGLRVAFLAASRRDDEWKGVTPLRLAALPLTEFNTDVVQQALHDLSAEMGSNFPPEEFQANAVRVHRVTAGLPALLARCLQWIRGEQWLGMGRLETQEQFEELASPYIRQELLTPACLLPEGQEEAAAAEALHALAQAYRVLTPYRFFTHSHLRYHLEADAELRAALAAAGWELADLWQAISRTALLRRPLNEPWKEIHGAIRRLLYRYFYRSDEERVAAHIEARKFVEIWANQQSGTEQVVGLVECLWHEAVALGLREPAGLEQHLTESARALSKGLRETSITVSELREYAADLMRDDSELEEAINNDGGLLGRLVETVLRPGD